MQAASGVGMSFSLMTPIGKLSKSNRISSSEHVLSLPAHMPDFTHITLHTQVGNEWALCFPPALMLVTEPKYARVNAYPLTYSHL